MFVSFCLNNDVASRKQKSQAVTISIYDSNLTICVPVKKLLDRAGLATPRVVLSNDSVKHQSSHLYSLPHCFRFFRHASLVAYLHVLFSAC